MLYDSSEFGTRMIPLMAAAMLVVQLLIVGQRLLPTAIRLFSLQSFFLACLATTVACFNHARHIYIAGFLHHVGHLNLGQAQPETRRGESDWWRLSPMLLLAALTLLLGVWLPDPLLRLIEQASQIIGGGP